MNTELIGSRGGNQPGQETLTAVANCRESRLWGWPETGNAVTYQKITGTKKACGIHRRTNRNLN